MMDMEKSKLDEFKNIMIMFIQNLKTVIPQHQHNDLNQVSLMMYWDPKRALGIFLSEIGQYKEYIMNDDDTFIKQVDMPLLQHYDSVDEYSKQCIMQYIKRLYTCASSYCNHNQTGKNNLLA